ncbi:VWA domain-containing protein [bacterium]|nr:VWA domain-containing protein [bacterium]
MTITTSNQQPIVLNSMYQGSIAAPFDPYTTVKDEVVKTLFTPLIPNNPVTIEMDGTPLTEDDITDILFKCSDDTIAVTEEDKMREIFRQTLAFYDKSLPVQDVYAVQAGKKMNMLLPSDRVIYTPSDVIDAAKQFLGGQLSRDGFFATISFFTRVSTMGYFFANNAAWEEFKAWFATEISAISSLLSSDTMKLCADLQLIKLNHLTESFVLRDDTTQNNEPYSFARLFVFYLMLYEQNLKTNNKPVHIAGHLPFAFAETFCPCTMVIINVEKHAHAHPSEIKNEWDIVKAALQMKPKVLGKNQIMKLTAVSRMANKIKNAGAATKSSQMNRSAIIRFRKTPPTSVDLYSYIMKIYKHASYIQTSENAVKYKKMTYQRPSRRAPDDPDRQGKTTGTIYKPDLHVYLDCSGSISERDYQDAIKACIKLAKKMNVNFYFNSFSHIMSAATKLEVKDKSVKEIYNIFKNTPKVGGGTNYEQIWHYINRSAKLEKQVSIVISDFEYSAPNHYVKHPKFLYYAPISTNNWNWITTSAKNFAKSMISICPDIRKHILM